jgi:hypothetical protein
MGSHFASLLFADSVIGRTGKKAEKFYLPEMKELLKMEVEGADEAVIFDWRV